MKQHLSALAKQMLIVVQMPLVVSTNINDTNFIMTDWLNDYFDQVTSCR